jgi:putative restriction endonuclease
VTREEFLDVLARLRCAPVGRARLRAPHKPLLLLWLFGRFTSTGAAPPRSTRRSRSRSAH